MKILVFTLAFVTYAAHAKVGGQEGSGGGGLIKEKGVYVTFGTAGFFTDAEPKETVPSLDVIQKAVNNLGIADSYKKRILEAVYPIRNREYYDIQPDGISETDYAKLIQQYVGLTAYPADKVALFAVTHPQSRITYLLPAFYKLKPAEQAAILFHEAYWILKPSATYAEVVRAEIAFQKWVEADDQDGFSIEMARVIGKLFDQEDLAFNWALSSDLAKGHIAPIMSWPNGGKALNMYEFLGLIGIRPEEQTLMKTSSPRGSGRSRCELPLPITAVEAYALSRKLPKSAWLPLLAKKLKSQSNGSEGYQLVLTFPSATILVKGWWEDTAVETCQNASFRNWNAEQVTIQPSSKDAGKILIQVEVKYAQGFL